MSFTSLLLLSISITAIILGSLDSDITKDFKGILDAFGVLFCIFTIVSVRLDNIEKKLNKLLKFKGIK
jgi:hypothetical protein